MKTRSSQSPDIVIVGGGLIGCACAYSLARRGLAVTLIERADLASGASGACDGHLCCQSKISPTHLDLARRSLALHQSLSDELGEDTGFRRCGSWMIAETAVEIEGLRARVEGLIRDGIDVSLHEGGEVHAAEPVLAEGLAGGSFCPTDGQVDPWRTTLALARQARHLGARIELGTEVHEVLLEQGSVVGVRTSAGSVTSGSVLLAAGAWTTELCRPLGIELPLRPRRGEIIVTEAMPPMVASIVLHAPYVAAKKAPDGGRTTTLVLEQIAEGNLLIGSTREYSGLDLHTSLDGTTGIANEVRRLAPGLRDLNVIRSFAGLRPCSGDGLPLIGPVPDVEGLYVATGHEGDGIALAPVTGEVVGDALVGNADWPPSLLPSRFATRP